MRWGAVGSEGASQTYPLNPEFFSRHSSGEVSYFIGPWQSLSLNQHLWFEQRQHDPNELIACREETLMSSMNCPFEEGDRIDHKLFGFGAVAGGPVAVVGPDARGTGVRDAGSSIPVKMGGSNANRRSSHASSATQSVIA